MKHHYVKGRPDVVTMPARITSSDGGSFSAIASTGRVDRDGESIAPGALNPLPATVAVHLGHDLTAKNAVAVGIPRYERDQLLIDATFGTDPDSQYARRKVQEGLIAAVSIAFLGKRWETRAGIKTLVEGELLSVDLVSVPSNSDARILSARSLTHGVRERALDLEADVLVTLARAEIAEAKALLLTTRHNHRRSY
jgi:HK97 family phage prohead protease